MVRKHEAPSLWWCISFRLVIVPLWPVVDHSLESVLEHHSWCHGGGCKVSCRMWWCRGESIEVSNKKLFVSLDRKQRDSQLVLGCSVGGGDAGMRGARVVHMWVMKPWTPGTGMLHAPFWGCLGSMQRRFESTQIFTFQHPLSLATDAFLYGTCHMLWHLLHNGDSTAPACGGQIWWEMFLWQIVACDAMGMDVRQATEPKGDWDMKQPILPHTIQTVHLFGSMGRVTNIEEWIRMAMRIILKGHS